MIDRRTLVDRRRALSALPTTLPDQDGGRAARILVADDSAAKRYLVVHWLTRAGYHVVEAETGLEALEVARLGIDLVVLDVRLPDMSGFEVCRILKSTAETSLLPVLHLSAHVTRPEDRATGLDGGADAYLTHPVEPTELLATIRALLRIRHAEMALRASEERYRLVARATNDVLWDWDLRTNELLWNQAAARLFGRPAADVGSTALWWFEQIHADDRARVVAGLHQAIDADTVDVWSDEYRIVRGDGSVATVFDRGYVLHNHRAEPIRMIGSMVDITTRKRAEEMQRFLVDATTTLSSTLDFSTTLRTLARLVVPRLADWCAVYTVDEAGEPHELDAAGIDEASQAMRAAAVREHPGGAAAVLDAVTRVMRDRAPLLVADVGESLPAHGVPHELAAFAAALGVRSHMIVPLEARGRVVGAMSFSTSRSRRRYDSRDLEVAADLARRAALAVDNARLYDSALVANRAKSDFLAVMSHELRTPLNAVLGYTGLLMSGVSQEMNETSRRYLERTRECALHLLQLIEQILIYSRVEAGREEVRAEVLDLVSLITESVAMLEPLAREKQLQFSVRVPPHPVPLSSDPGKVRQILLNLLSNAIKFTDRGSVEVELRLDGQRALVTVRDTGIGIALENLEHIFDPFWQVEQQKTRRVGGSGLGLTVSRRLARLLRGDLTVTSSPGSGSTFRLELPLTER